MVRYRNAWVVISGDSIGVFHCIYIIGMSLINFFFLYSIHNSYYINNLFTSVSSAAQGGLNTASAYCFTLYQQIIIYNICCLGTPIFIHGPLAFVKLYWFERYFDNIRYTSKQSFTKFKNKSSTIQLKNLFETK